MARPPLNRSKISTKEKIFAAAAELFAQQGYHGVSIRDITKEVGIKESSFYNHYQSKDNLLDEILNYFKVEISRAKLPDHLQDDAVLQKVDPLLFLERSTANFIRYADTQLMAKIYRIVVIEQFHDPRARDIMLGLYETALPLLTHYFELVLERTADCGDNARILAHNYQFAFHAMIAEFSLCKHYQWDTQLMEQRIRELNHFFGEYVKSLMKGKQKDV